jgi:hypothetical protein
MLTRSDLEAKDGASARHETKSLSEGRRVYLFVQPGRKKARPNLSYQESLAVDDLGGFVVIDCFAPLETLLPRDLWYLSDSDDEEFRSAASPAQKMQIWTLVHPRVHPGLLLVLRAPAMALLNLGLLRSTLVEKSLT